MARGRSFLRFNVLHWTNMVVVYTMWVLMTYLTDVWKFSITHAAAIVNVYSGLVGIMPIGMAFLLDHCLGSYWMVVLSSLTYSIGLSFLTMSTPPVLSKVTGTCSAYEPACIGNTQSILFYASLALIAVGMSSHSVSKNSFREENRENYNNEVGFPQYAVTLVIVAAIISVAYTKPWCEDTATATSLLSSETAGERGFGLLRTPGVDETSIILRIIPMWMTFIVCGLVISVGNTYFLAQAIHMNRKLGSLHVPVEFLLWYYTMTKWAKSRSYEKAKKKFHAAFLASIPLADCILCCIIAALVESKRLHVVQKYGLIDKPDATIPMSMFWLLPQLVFLGAIENVAGEILAIFCAQEVPDSMLRYLPLLTEAVLGAGTIGSVLSVYIVDKVSKMGGRLSWFHDTLNKSRLDNYYWLLAVLSSINYIVYFLLVAWYNYRKIKSKTPVIAEIVELLSLMNFVSVQGLSFLAMSTPPVLSKFTGTCSAYEPACIGNIQSIFFYVALALIAVGKSSHSVSIKSFREIQQENQDGLQKFKGLGDIVVIIALVAAIILVAYIKPCFGKNSDMTLPYEMLSILMECRCEVAFVGVVISVGNTYFLEQANHMNQKLGSLHVPIDFLLFYYNMVKWSKDQGYERIDKETRAGILAAFPLLNSILCFIVAALVEAKRLHVVKKYGLIDKPEDRIPMSMFWLLPQLFFLGNIESNAEEIITKFWAQEVLVSLKRYQSLFTKAIFGAGTIGSVLSVYIVDKVSKRGGRLSWFQDTLNRSHLDKYYWVLTVLSSINFVSYLCCWSPALDSVILFDPA
ncbi:hypothetical protein HHK36_022323 [Tetracentron sinense]|uniref:Uncharacterized protein n=1 Tax=Tetracentron sinense TaxID=13715 RepID=A0A835D600_TETSI|nr:hypothetical protein HHK36_022323 [Tetracentron sinense]